MSDCCSVSYQGSFGQFFALTTGGGWPTQDINVKLIYAWRAIAVRFTWKSIAVISIDPPETMDTERLLLRVPVLEDASKIFNAYTSKPRICRYMSWTAHTTVDQTTAYIKGGIANWIAKSDFDYVIEMLGNAGNPIGMISMHPKRHGVGFGYVIAEEYWNNGITSEALTELVNWSLAQDEIHRAEAFCDVENIASAKVMEKAGMSFEGKLRRYFVHPNLSDKPRDSLMYAKVR